MAAVSPPRFDPARLVEAAGDGSLRSTARRLGIDPALLCRPLTTGQADRYATALGLHPGDVWGSAWWAPGSTPW